MFIFELCICTCPSITERCILNMQKQSFILSDYSKGERDQTIDFFYSIFLKLLKK